MKFGKQLRETVDESLEDWRCKFMCYKKLKKCIEPCNPNNCLTSNNNNGRCLTTRSSSVDAISTEIFNEHSLDHGEAVVARNVTGPDGRRGPHGQFMCQLLVELDKVNDFFLDKQEDLVIEHERLSGKLKTMLREGPPTNVRGVNRTREQMTNLHGHLVLLDNFCTVNYTAFCKILKKHDKKTCVRLRPFFLQSILQTPIFLSNVVHSLIATIERQLFALPTLRTVRLTHLPADRPPHHGDAAPKDSPGQSKIVEGFG